MKTKLISLLIISAALVCNAAFAESGYIQHVRKNAEAGQAWAEKAMGDAFYFGVDMEVNSKEDMEANHKKAVEWYRKAAEHGDSAAMHAIGRSYFFGEGAEENYKKAAEWYRKAAEAGDDGALYSLARMYEYGIGVDEDLSEAAKLYGEAIGEEIDEHSNMNALYALARMDWQNGLLRWTSDRDILLWSVLMAASNMTGEYWGYKDAENAVDDLHLDASPLQYKKILNVSKEIYDDFDVYFHRLTKDALVNLSVRIAEAKSPIEPLSAEDVYNRIWPSVVFIETETIDGFGGGSGVIVQPDIVATNCHVLEDADIVWVHQPKERSGTENEPFLAYDSVGSDGRDYCLLYVPGLPGSGVPATIRPYDTLTIGETVYALGAPDRRKLSLSKGIISQLRDEVDYIEYAPARSIQSDVDIAPGSSGGGLFDSAGNLIGHPTFGDLDEELLLEYEGLEFSIPADIVLEFE